MYFQDFKNQVMNKSECKVKCLRTNTGEYFFYNEFFKFYKDCGIKRQLTTTYTPQQNGVVESKNYTIIEMARSMIQTKDLINQYWVDAVRITMYILNRSLTLSFEGVTPYE